MAFLDDLTIPFDNNQTEQAERDLRLLKTQKKVSDCFRLQADADALTHIQGWLSTLRKQGVALLDTRCALFTGVRLYPAVMSSYVLV